MTELVPTIWTLTEVATAERVAETELAIQLREIHFRS